MSDIRTIDRCSLRRETIFGPWEILGGRFFANSATYVILPVDMYRVFRPNPWSVFCLLRIFFFYRKTENGHTGEVGMVPRIMCGYVSTCGMVLPAFSRMLPKSRKTGAPAFPSAHMRFPHGSTGTNGMYPSLGNVVDTGAGLWYTMYAARVARRNGYGPTSALYLSGAKDEYHEI